MLVSACIMNVDKLQRTFSSLREVVSQDLASGKEVCPSAKPIQHSLIIPDLLRTLESEAAAPLKHECKSLSYFRWQILVLPT